MPGEYVFGRGSNVLEYWLSRAEGFVVRSRGSRVGVVRRVVLDPGRGRASALILRSPLLRRRRVVLASSVDAVDPAERVLELEPTASRSHSRSWRATLAPAAGRTGAAAGMAFRRVQRWSDEVDGRFDAAGAWLRPRLRAWLVAAAVCVRDVLAAARTSRRG